MQVNDPLHDRQPEPSARCLRPRRSIEATADVRALIGRDAGTCIPHHHAYIGVGDLHVHVDLRARGAVPDGVVDDVSEENREKPGVAGDQHVLFMRQLDVHPVRECGGRQIADRALQHRRELQWGRLERHGIGSQTSERQHLLDRVRGAIAAGDHAIQCVCSLGIAGRAQRDLRLGTDASERWTRDEFRAWAKPFFARGKAWSFTAVSRHVSFSKDGMVAWFDEALSTPNMGPARGSGVLVKDGSAWKIAQYNLSIPIPNDLMDDFKARIEAHAKKQKGK